MCPQAQGTARLENSAGSAASERLQVFPPLDRETVATGGIVLMALTAHLRFRQVRAQVECDLMVQLTVDLTGPR